MPVTELRTWEIRCDGRECRGASVIVTGSHYPSLPSGWKAAREISVGDGASATYALGDILCTYCQGVVAGASEKPTPFQIGVMRGELTAAEAEKMAANERARTAAGPVDQMRALIDADRAAREVTNGFMERPYRLGVFRGAVTHSGAMWLTQLNRLGYVIARADAADTGGPINLTREEREEVARVLRGTTHDATFIFADQRQEVARLADLIAPASP